MVKAVFLMRQSAFESAFAPAIRRRIASLVEVGCEPYESLAAIPRPTSDLDIVISGWGAPSIDSGFLEQCPRLQTVFHAAGSVGQVMTLEAWQRGLRVTSAASANAIPVAEYTVAMIVLNLKRVFTLASLMRELRGNPPSSELLGCYRRTVALVSLGAVGREVARRLSTYEVTVLGYDPLMESEVAELRHVKLVPLDELFAQADVVSVHAPELPETAGLIGRSHLRSMKWGATLINTARGSIIDEDALIDVASARSDLMFVLDVTRDMPPTKTSPLYDLPNVALTPHIAGSQGRECERLGEFIADELARYVRGESLLGEITFETACRSSHLPQLPRHREFEIPGNR